MSDLIVLGLALWQAIETWHHGSLFIGARNRLRELQDSSWAGVRFLGEAVSCMFCLSHWVGLALVSLYFLCDGKGVIAVIVYTLAVIRFAQLGNDLTHSFSRSPPSDVVTENELMEFMEPGDVTPGDFSEKE